MPAPAPYWLDRVPRSRRPSYPRLRGRGAAPVVIVGGGLTGCACAWSFAAAGIDVVLLEAEAIGAQGTARGSGVIREDFDASFEDAEALHGLRSARLLWQSMRRASLDFPAALRRLNIRCDLAPLDIVQFAHRDPESARQLRREYEARRGAGFAHSWLTPPALARATNIGGAVGIKTHGAAIDPYRACIGLAAAAEARGAAVHEKSPVRRIKVTRNQVEIATDGGSISADAVLVATSAPLQDLKALRRHLKPADTYTVVTEPLPSAVRREVGGRASALRDSDVPPHFLRWLPQDRLLYAGAEGPPAALRAREKTRIQRAGQLMYELSTLYPAISGLQAERAWNATTYDTADHLPLIGPHRSFPRHLFALGHARHGAAFAWLAARILLRQYQGEPAKADGLFSFSRIL